MWGCVVCAVCCVCCVHCVCVRVCFCVVHCTRVVRVYYGVVFILEFVNLHQATVTSRAVAVGINIFFKPVNGPVSRAETGIGTAAE